MKIIRRTSVLILVLLGLAACGIKGDVKPPQPKSSTHASYPVR